jgi:hypothetical protein
MGEPEHHPIGLWTKFLFLLCSGIATAAFAEGIVRLGDGNALPVLGIFASKRGLIVLQPSSHARLRSAAGQIHDIETDELGLRLLPAKLRHAAQDTWLIAGDSQVLGLGVSAAETVSAHASARGRLMLGAGVPGHGVEDALAHAERLLPKLRPRAVVVVVNQANDWDEAGSRSAERFCVRRGFLVRQDHASALVSRFVGSPLASSHLFHHLMQLFHGLRAPSRMRAPSWLAAGAQQRVATKAIADAILSFSTAHPTLPVLAAFLPADAATSAARAKQSPFARFLRAGQRPWRDRTLRDALAARLPAEQFTDLTSALSSSPAMFLEGDYHLSPLGHAAVAKELVATLEGRFGTTANASLPRGRR